MSDLIEALTTRFEQELEFVECLGNPWYLQHLALSHHLSNPKFVKYLEYLRYWEQAQYAKFLSYPLPSLTALRLLQLPTFRSSIAETSNVARYIEGLLATTANGTQP